MSNQVGMLFFDEQYVFAGYPLRATCFGDVALCFITTGCESDFVCIEISAPRTKRHLSSNLLRRLFFELF